MLRFTTVLCLLVAVATTPLVADDKKTPKSKGNSYTMKVVVKGMT